MQRQTVPPSMEHMLLKHLQDEESVLRKVRQLAVGMSDDDPASVSLSDRRGEIEQTVRELQHIQLQRRQLLTDLGRCLACPPEQVRLSRIRLREAALDATLQRQRTDLQTLTAETSGTVRMAQRTLVNRNAIVNAMLDVLLASTGGTVRYSPRGERVATTMALEIDMRS